MFIPPPIGSSSVQPAVQAAQISEKVIHLIHNVDDKKASQIAESEMASLQQALEKDTDVMDRILDILKENGKDKNLDLRHLREITSYLKILESHLQDEQDSSRLTAVLHPLIIKIQRLVTHKTEEVEQSWKTLLHELDDQISKERKIAGNAKKNQSNLLDNRKPLPISDKNYAHIHAESFITHTELEGNSKRKMLECCISYCKNLSRPSPKTEEFIQMCSDCLEFVEKFGLDSVKAPGEIEEIQEECVEEIQSKLKSLEPGKSLMLPSGWVNIEGSHAMYLVASREEDGTFKVKIFNSGSGLDNYHTSFLEDEQFKYQPYLHFENVDAQRMGGRDFLKAYLETLTVVSNADGKLTEYGKKDVYEALLNSLGGTKITAPPDYDQFIHGQRTGNCTWASLMAVALHTLGPKEYARASYEIKLNSLCDFFTLSGNEPLRSDTLTLLQTSAELFAADLLDFYKQGTLSLEELDQANETLKAVFAHIQSSRLKLAFSLGSGQTVDFKAAESLPLRRGELLPSLRIAQVPSAGGAPGKPPSLRPYEDFSWAENPAAFLAGIQQFQQWICEFPRDADQEILKMSLIRFYEHLPMPAVQDGFLNRLPETDLLDSMQCIADINEFIFISMDRGYINPDRYPMLQAGALKSLAVVKNLALLSHTLPAELLKTSLTHRDFVLSLIGTDRSGRPLLDANIYDVALRQQVEDCISYLDSTEERFTYSGKNMFIFKYQYGEGSIGHLFTPHFLESGEWENPEEIKYMLNELQKPAVKDKFFQSHPEARTLPRWRQMVAALGDLQSDWMPPAFAALKKQAFLCLAFSKQVPPRNCSKDGKLVLPQLERPGFVALSALISPVDALYRDLNDEALQFLVQLSRAKRVSYEPYYTESNLKSVNFTGSYEVRNVEKKNITMAEAQELMALMAGGEYDADNPHLPMQVLRTLSYFLNHKDKMQEPNYQSLFRLLVFEDNYLEKLMSSNPDVITTLQEFIQKQVDFFRDRGDIQTMCFLIECSRTFQAITLRKLGPEKARDFADPVNFLMELLSRSDLTESEKTLLYKHLAASFAASKPSSFTEAHCLSLLQAVIFIRQHPGSSVPHSSHLKTEYDSALIIYADEIERHVKGRNGSALLNRLAGVTEAESEKNAWSMQNYPVCQSSDGLTSIDLSSGTVYKKNQLLSVLPREILDSPLFGRLFARKDYIARKNQCVYEFMDENRTRARVILEDTEPVIQKEWVQGQWYELYDSRKLNRKAWQSLGGAGLIEGYDLWVCLPNKAETILLATDKEGNISHRWRCSLAQPLTDEEAFEPLMKDKELRDFLFNRSDIQDSDEAEIARAIIYGTPEDYLPILLSIEQGRLKKNPRLKAWDPLQSKSVIRLLNTPADQLNPVLHKAQNVLKHLRSRQGVRVDAIEKILPDGQILSLAVSENGGPKGMETLWKAASAPPLLWKNLQGEPALLEFPQLGLSFTFAKSKRGLDARSLNFPGLKISPNQHVKGLEDFHNKIVLEDAKGNRKAAVPQLPLIPLKAGALTKEMTQLPAKNGKTTFMILEVDAKAGVHSPVKEHRLYLAYIQLGLKNYRNAQDILRETYSKAIPYTEEERKILLWILRFHKDSLDGDPRACAVSMTAFALLIMDDPEKLPKTENKDFWKLVKDQYDLYAESGNLSGTSKLTEAEEFKILTYLNSHQLGSSLTRLRMEKYRKDLPEALQRLSIRHAVQMPFPSIKSMDRQEFIGFCTSLEAAAKSIKGSPLISRPGNSLARAVFYEGFYQKIKEKAPEARVALNFARLDSDVDPIFLEILDAVWQFPDLFPSEVTLVRMLQGDYSAFKQFVDKLSEKALHTLSETSVLRPSPAIVSKKVPKIEEKKISAGEAMTRSVKAMPSIFKKGQSEEFFKEVPFAGIALTESEMRELQEALDLKEIGSLGAAKTKEIQEDVAEAWATPPSRRPFLNPDKAKSLKTALLVQQGEQKKLLADQTQTLLANANELPADLASRLAQDIEWKAVQKEPITFRDLCILIANQDFQRLKEKNASLDDEKINVLYNSMLQVLERGKYVQKIERSLAIVEEMLNKIGTCQNLDALSNDLYYLDLSQRLASDLARPTAYKVHEEPEYSLFEFLANIQLFPGQTEDLDILGKAEGGSDIVLQKIMGSGKSKVYLPILALKKAKGKILPVIVVTAAQYQTTLRDMQASSGQIFHQVAYTFHFDRGTDCSPENLHKILEDFSEIIRKRGYLIVTDKTIHCLLDKCGEMTLNYMTQAEEYAKAHPNAPAPGLPPELQELRKILSMLKKGVLDEADLLLHSKHEVNFTMGQPDSLVGSRAAAVGGLYLSIYSNPDIIASITPKTKTSSAEPAFTPEEYATRLRPKIAESFLRSEEGRSTLLGRYFQSLNLADKELIYDYLINGEKGDLFVAVLKDEDLKHCLAVVKEEVNEILPITLLKTTHFHYGFSPVKNELLAIPYVGNGKPSETSRFGNPYELLSYTIQAYYMLGIPETKLRSLTDGMKAQAMKEMAADPALNVAQTAAYEQFKKLCGGGGSYNLMRLSDQDIARIGGRFKGNLSDLLDFLQSYVFPQVQIYPWKISSNHLTLVDAFEQTAGFTGTPWNKDTYHKRIRTISDKGTDGKTLGILWKNSKDNIRLLPSSDLDAVLDHLFKNRNAGSLYRTLQDSGALFNGIDNETVTRKILERLPPNCRGVKFFDKENKLCVLEKGRREPLPAEKSLLPPEDCFTYYDQWNTTGKDIKQMPLARGFVTVGKTLTRRDLLQCVWRLRELDKGQAVELAVPPEVADLISKEFKIDLHSASSLKYILKFVELNQLRQLEKQVLTSTFQAIHHVAENEIRKILFRPDVDLAQLKDSFPQLKKILQISTRDAPYEQFGRKEADEPTSVVMQRKIDAAIALVNPLIGTHRIFDHLDLEKMKADMENAIPWNLLPSKVSALSRTSRELTVEVERETEREEEVNMQRLKELEEESDSSDRRKHACHHWNWTGVSEELTPSRREYFKPAAVDTVIDKSQTNELPSLSNPEFHPISQGMPPVMTLKDIFLHSKGLEPFSDIFDLEATYNFLPVTSTYISDGNSERHRREYAIPFDNMQLGVKSFLLVRDKTDRRPRMILIDQADAGYFYDRLAEEKEKDAGVKEQSVALGEINLGILVQSDRAAAENYSDNPDWVRLLVQAKFFNGELVYTKSEQKYLSEWIKSKGPKRMEKLFYEHILRHKLKVKEFYPGSILGKMFSKLLENRLYE